MNTNQSDDNLIVSTDKGLLDKKAIIAYLQKTYWGKDHSEKQILKSIEHSFCFGLYLDNNQAGFARVVTDFTYSAWVADVFILDHLQGKGYGQILMNAIFTHPELNCITKWRLATNDAHTFYAKFGFGPLKEPGKILERSVAV